MEAILSIIVIIATYCACHATEWKSNNRTCPPGYEMDWLKANQDLIKHGEDYYHQMNLLGKYDKKKD